MAALTLHPVGFCAIHNGVLEGPASVLFVVIVLLSVDVLDDLDVVGRVVSTRFVPITPTNRKMAMNLL